MKPVHLIVCGTLLCAAALTTAPPLALAEPSGEAKKRLAACDHYMAAYARSSARKLSRALSGQKFEFTELPSQTRLNVDGEQFDLLVENDGAAAGVIERRRAHRRTYVLSHYEIGPLIAVHRWPSRDAVASGRQECKPISSRIAFPEVPVAAVDVEPFKFWGLRVIWHVPTDLPAEVAKASPLDALREVIATAE